jgi:alpha-methylacyl-CoA racemase
VRLLDRDREGPLQGVRVLEIGGVGPGPFAGMILADMGADVVRVERFDVPGLFPDPSRDLLNRGKRSVALDLKHHEAVAAVLTMAERADVLIEGYRPGVAERLGIGPGECHARNRRLVYGRMTGWGQDGPLAQRAGHDIGYIALTGALHAIGDTGGPPQIPLNVVGDFGGGGTYLVMGVLAAMWEAARTGEGRVVDAAIVDGTSHLLSAVHALLNTDAWTDERGVNMLDGGAPFYAVYETSDGRHMAVGAIEPAFYALLLGHLGLDGVDPADQHRRDTWPGTRQAIAEAFAGGSQGEWAELFGPTDACVTPVLSLREAAAHPHLRERGTVVLRDGVVQAGPAPRFSGMSNTAEAAPPRPGQHTRDVLVEHGVDVERLLSVGAASDRP